jgi:hypothetical protein
MTREPTRAQLGALTKAMIQASALARQHRDASNRAWKMLNGIVGYEVDVMRTGDEVVEVVEYGAWTTLEEVADLVRRLRGEPVGFLR